MDSVCFPFKHQREKNNLAQRSHQLYADKKHQPAINISIMGEPQSEKATPQGIAFYFSGDPAG